MNKEKLCELASKLYKLPKAEFDWFQWCSHHDASEQTAHSCGTQACVAGWTVLFEKGYKIEGGYAIGPDGEKDTISETAQNILGLSDDEARTLFYPGRAQVAGLVTWSSSNSPGPRQAANAIRKFVQKREQKEKHA